MVVTHESEGIRSDGTKWNPSCILMDKVKRWNNSRNGVLGCIMTRTPAIGHLRQQFSVPIGSLSGGVSMLWETTLKGPLSSSCPLDYRSNNSCYEVINLIKVHSLRFVLVS